MRESGVAVIVDELELGVASISVGVRLRGRLAAVVNVTGPTLRFDDAARRRPGRGGALASGRARSSGRSNAPTAT